MKPLPRLIGLGHQARTGKDTVATLLVNSLGYYRIGFADKLREVTQVAYDFTDAQIWGNEKLIVDDRWGISPVTALQIVGTEMFRRHDPDFWVKAAFAKMDRYAKSRMWVITDVRFHNEAEAVKKRGGMLLKIVRPADLRGDIGRDPNHPSEIDLNDYEGWDAVIVNDGTIADLHERVLRVVRRG